MLNLLAAVFAHHSSSDRNLATRQTPSSRGVGRSATRRCAALLAAAMMALAAMAGLCVTANAQVRFGTIVGTVDDASGAVVSGATVKLISTTSLGRNR